MLTFEVEGHTSGDAVQFKRHASFLQQGMRGDYRIGRRPNTLCSMFLLQPVGVVNTHFSGQSYKEDVLPEPPSLDRVGELRGRGPCIQRRQYTASVPLAIEILARG